MKPMLVLSLLVVAVLTFAMPAAAFDTDLTVDGVLLGHDLLYGGPGGIFLAGDGTVFDGLVNFDLYAGGNGEFLDVGLDVRDCLTAPFLTSFAAYSDQWGESQTVAFTAGLVVTFDAFADVQTAGLTWHSPFELTDFDLFVRLECDVGRWLELVSELTTYVEIGIVPIWDGDAFTTATRWAFGFDYQWIEIPVPRAPNLEGG